MTRSFPQRVHLLSRGLAKVFGECEALLMEILWKKGPMSVRSVVRELNHRGRRLSFNATMTILNRLVEKGVLVKQKERRNQGVTVYAPRTDRLRFRERMSREVFRRFFSDREFFSVAGFTDAIDHLSAKDRAQIRKLLRQGSGS